MELFVVHVILIKEMERKMGTQKFSLADRMGRYERVSSHELTRRVPVIIRVDGRAFHTLTNYICNTGWDENFAQIMANTMCDVLQEIQGCNFAYTQSDEISFLLTDYETIHTDSFFGYEVNKLNSIAASLTTFYFNKYFTRYFGDKTLGRSIIFDARCFNCPADDATNYFLWRQRDCLRNAIQTAGRKYFSHKALEGKNSNQIQDMLYEHHDINFNDYSPFQKRGCVTTKTAAGITTY
jgi:tRNA(His) 5'-end guanylyltransferase